MTITPDTMTPDTVTPDTTALLTLDGVGKSFGSVRALDGVHLAVQPRSVHCILGENGAGKSTLCNAIYGTVSPDAGRMTLAGADYRPQGPVEALRAGVAMVHQHFSLIPTMTVGDNLLLGGDGFRPARRELAGDLDRIADTYGLSVDAKSTVRDLSVGARQRVEIVKALLRNPRLILLDEPTAVLDPAEIDALMATCAALTDDGKSVVLITHKLAEVARAADEATVLRGGTVVGGGRLADVSLSTLTELMLGDAPPVTAERAPRRDTPTNAPICLQVNGITVKGADGRTALSDVDLTVRAGEIVGIAGVEGNGQSELTAVLSGASTPDAGTVSVDGEDLTDTSPARRTRAGVAVIPEDRHAEGMVAALSIAENIAMPRLANYRRWGLLDRRRMRVDAADAITAYGVRAPGPDTTMGELSGGNQQKVVLARELATDRLRVVVAAQPTRGLDVGAVAFVLDRLRDAADAGAAVLVTSSEIDELIAVCDRVTVAYRGGLRGSVDTGDPRAAQTIGRLLTGVGE
ncbi:ABC transporter ATP-binding protein [Gordonia insulae]|uniref:Galactose/methyl galactoside import ATP-binding protein MglA n=1 Tax=Gordonia insulae TaxID=2420509 RepID=A0A3G8JQG8_9ACTN|nr:ABC transporter ATP-binding protein [Gordonia insulae]AZG46420.1 Galactose/methyl galactoside import ATP-binding protein MglA [Gordonia insulae]